MQAFPSHSSIQGTVVSPTPRISARRALLLAASACLSLGLAACGGGAAAVALIGGGVGTGGTGMVLGTVVGLGSVIVDGQSYSSATPGYFSASGSTGETASNSQAIEVGARVDLLTDGAGQPSKLLIQPELEGAPVYDGSTGRLSVNGVRVLVNSNPARGPVTFYTGLTGLAGGSAPAVAAARIEVHGVYAEDASGPYVLASLIEQLPATDPAARITGVVGSLSSQSLSVAGWTIPLGSGTTVVTPRGGTLAAGEVVHAWNNGGHWVVSVQGLGSFSGPVQLSGVAYGMSSGGFMLSGVPVDTSGLPGSTPPPQAGDYVVVNGRGDGNGTLLAQSIQAAPTTVDIQGTITGYVGASSFQVRGVPIDASAASYAAGSSAALLGNGAYVRIQGAVSPASPNVIAATSVQVLPAPPVGETVDLQGTITSMSDAGHFTLQWQAEQEGSSSTQYPAVTVAPNGVYVNGSAAGIVVGATVEVEGTYQDGALNAYTVKFLAGGEPSGTQQISGRVYGWTSGGSSFMLNGISMTVPQGVSIPAGFDNGANVEVGFTPSASGSSGTVQSITLDN